MTDTDYNAATALGGITKGVSNLELTAAYATIANQGIYTKPRFFTQILDHNGKVLLDNTPETKRVLKDSTAFLLTDAMSQSMESSRMYGSGNLYSTSTSANLSNMSNAGKSGTTTKQQRYLVRRIHALLYGGKSGPAATTTKNFRHRQQYLLP